MLKRMFARVVVAPLSHAERVRSRAAMVLLWFGPRGLRFACPGCCHSTLCRVALLGGLRDVVADELRGCGRRKGFDLGQVLAVEPGVRA